MAHIDKQVSQVTTIYSGASVTFSEGGSTEYTAITGIAVEGFDYAVAEVTYTSENTTDDLDILIYSSLSGTTDAASGSICDEQPIFSQRLTATPSAGSGVSQVATIMIPDVPYAFLGMVPEPISTSHQVEVKIATIRWNS